MKCPHNPEDWIDADDGCTYCEECDSGVCWNCGELFTVAGYGVDTDQPYYEPPCDCESLYCTSDDQGRDLP